MKIKAVIFDFDEVIIKSYTDHAQAFLETAKKFELKINKKALYKRFGKSAKEILQELLPQLTESERKEFVKEKETLYRKIISKKGIKATNNTRELLEFLENKKIKCAISSSASIKNITIALKKTKLKKYFKATVAAEHVKHHKPHPEPLLKAAKLLKTKPSNCIYIGDSIFEMQAAKRAGMISMAILTGVYNSKELKNSGANYVFYNIGKVKTFLQKVIR